MRLLTQLERIAVGVLVILILHGAPARGQDPPPASDSHLEALEKEQCKTNLHTIYKAIEAYKIDHKDLPNWLSDLVPKYLPDANVLICPTCRRTGKTEGPPLADPNISSSYLFEFCPLPLGSAAPNAPQRTRREWKRRQMGLVGSKVPLVRCRHHDQALNLAFDGTVYESPMFWETLFTNVVSEAELSPNSIFAQDSGNGAAVRKYPPRDPDTPKQLLDLSKAYNAMLSESWHGGNDNQLQGLPSGIQNFAGVDFDVRGIIQLGGTTPGATRFPLEVKGIPVHQKCRRIHFLHSAAWGKTTDEGKQIGAYVVHFATNNMRLEIPIIYGHSVRDWHSWSSEPPAPKELVVAWKGENEVSKRAKASIRLFLSTWDNILPDVEIESIDIVSGKGNAVPFVLAISVE